MIFSRPIIIFTVLLFCSFSSDAQDTNYVYKDSAIFYEDSIAAAAKPNKEPEPDQNDDNESEDEYIADTILRYNDLFVDSDSIKAIKESKPFAYANTLDSQLYRYQQSLERDEVTTRKNMTWIGRIFSSPITKYFLWMVALVFVSFILYKLFFTEGFFQKNYAKINVAGLPDEEEDLLKDNDYGKLITQAIGNKNYRMAVRFHYLQTLQKLASKSAIQFAADKTNYQYVMELSGKKYKNLFASLTLHYEYVWYGEFNVDEVIFNSIQNKFKQFNSEVDR